MTLTRPLNGFKQATKTEVPFCPLNFHSQAGVNPLSFMGGGNFLRNKDCLEIHYYVVFASSWLSKQQINCC